MDIIILEQDGISYTLDRKEAKKHSSLINSLLTDAIDTEHTPPVISIQLQQSLKNFCDFVSNREVTTNFDPCKELLVHDFLDTNEYFKFIIGELLPANNPPKPSIPGIPLIESLPDHLKWEVYKEATKGCRDFLC